MAESYSEVENILEDYEDYEDYEDSRITLKTPEPHMLDITSCNDNNLNFNDYIHTEISSHVSDIPIINESTPELIKEADNIPFDKTEWKIIDLQSGKSRSPRQIEFLHILLENSRYSSYICWLNKNEGIFKILQPDQVVELWQKVKCRQTKGDMDYETFSRGVRCYYKNEQMIKTYKKYTFCFNKQFINNTGS